MQLWKDKSCIQEEGLFLSIRLPLNHASEHGEPCIHYTTDLTVSPSEISFVWVSDQVVSHPEWVVLGPLDPAPKPPLLLLSAFFHSFGLGSTRHGSSVHNKENTLNNNSSESVWLWIWGNPAALWVSDCTLNPFKNQRCWGSLEKQNGTPRANTKINSESIHSPHFPEY